MGLVLTEVSFDDIRSEVQVISSETSTPSEMPMISKKGSTLICEKNYQILYVGESEISRSVSNAASPSKDLVLFRPGDPISRNDLLYREKCVRH